MSAPELWLQGRFALQGSGVRVSERSPVEECFALLTREPLFGQIMKRSVCVNFEVKDVGYVDNRPGSF